MVVEIIIVMAAIVAGIAIAKFYGDTAETALETIEKLRTFGFALALILFIIVFAGSGVFLLQLVAFVLTVYLVVFVVIGLEVNSVSDGIGRTRKAAGEAWRTIR